MTSSQPDNGISTSVDTSSEQATAAAAAPADSNAQREARSESTDDPGQRIARTPPQSGDPVKLQDAARALDERDQIAKRIAAFRNLQISLKQEREDYYERTLARTRAALASDAKTTR
ncbi:hypothetical protein DNX69_04745 [Rhodopseudomonas palustris]|uniref:Uncharacterized protein n=1 Tax=Rhodopseudomonas palustris TaxID=1076 RepID=A0A323UKB4_RHOPL|nr:hypothetical protein [Rhodopseudomonas palustris]PZA13065.1 hypothetical protein DNX69_04745 [Rhodopseudomonas palustris]